MFAIGFFILGALFLAGVLFASTLLPAGKFRSGFVLGVLAFIFAYPFLHLIRPSYFKFKELCVQPSSPTIIKTKAVDFILLDGGYRSDCSKGPAYIANFGYLGFDCRKGNSSGSPQLFRYTKRLGADSNCGLECFDVKEILQPESSFGFFDNSSRTRAGYLVGDEKRVTVDYPNSKVEESPPFWRWLRFTETLLVDGIDGDMAFTTNYFYLPYGPITMLGLASGSAPAEQCPWPPGIDARSVYKAKQPQSTVSYNN